MNDLDQKIQDALKGSKDGELLAKEPNLAEEIITAFRGRNMFTTVFAVVFSIGATALMVWAGFRFYGAEAIREQLLWGGFCLINILFISFMKVWFWMEMHSNRVLRELKRIELLFLQREK